MLYSCHRTETKITCYTISHKYSPRVLEELNTESDSNLPLSGYGLLASSLMFLSLDFWIYTMEMNNTYLQRCCGN